MFLAADEGQGKHHGLAHQHFLLILIMDFRFVSSNALLHQLVTEDKAKRTVTRKGSSVSYVSDGKKVPIEITPMNGGTTSGIDTQ